MRWNNIITVGGKGKKIRHWDKIRGSVCGGRRQEGGGVGGFREGRKWNNVLRSSTMPLGKAAVRRLKGEKVLREREETKEPFA